MYKQTYMFIHACETYFQSCSLELEGLFVLALTTPAGPRCTDFSYLGHSDCLFQENHPLSCPLSRTSSLCNKYTVVFISCHWLGHYTTKNSVSWLFLTCTHSWVRNIPEATSWLCSEVSWWDIWKCHSIYWRWLLMYLYFKNRVWLKPYIPMILVYPFGYNCFRWLGGRDPT